MHTFYWILLYNSGLTIGILSLALLHYNTLPGDYPPVSLHTTISLASTIWYVFWAYYLIVKAALAFLRCCYRCRKRRHHHNMDVMLEDRAAQQPYAADHNKNDNNDNTKQQHPSATAENLATGVHTALYHDLSSTGRQNGTEFSADLVDTSENIMHGRPRLHMSDVWTLVYGLGFSYYVINYVFTCRDLLSMQSFVWGLTCNILIEIVQSEQPLMSAENFMYLTASVLASVGFLIRGCKEGYRHWIDPWTNHDMIGVVCGTFMTYLGALMFGTLKANQKYSFTGIYDLCEFGLPFAIILAFATAGFDRLYNNGSGGFEHLPNFTPRYYYATIFVGPVFLLLILEHVMHAVMHSHILDVLISLTLASGLVTLSNTPKDQMAISSVILSLLALFVRLTIVSDWTRQQVDGGANTLGPASISLGKRKLNSKDEFELQDREEERGVDDQDAPRRSRRVTHTIEEDEETAQV